MREKIDTLTKERKVANQIIMGKLRKYLNTYTGIRFSQMLINLDIERNVVDDYYLESSELLKRIKSQKNL